MCSYLLAALVDVLSMPKACFRQRLLIGVLQTYVNDGEHLHNYGLNSQQSELAANSMLQNMR